jgi:hypothetical protein
MYRRARNQFHHFAVIDSFSMVFCGGWLAYMGGSLTGYVSYLTGRILCNNGPRVFIFQCILEHRSVLYCSSYGDESSNLSEIHVQAATRITRWSIAN